VAVWKWGQKWGQANLISIFSLANYSLRRYGQKAEGPFRRGSLSCYPRVRDISTDYTGCQLLWMHDGKTWSTIAVVAIERGYAVRLWSQYETDPARLGCRYKEGKVVQGDPQRCPAPDFLIVKSLPPGCVERIKKAGGRFPPGCDYD